MAALVLPRRWQQQPQCAVEIDWSNPLTRGLKVAYSAASGVDAARNLPLSVRPALGASRYGVAAVGDGTNFAQFPSRPQVTSASFTLFSISKFTNGNCIFASENEYSNQWRIQPYPSGSNLVVNGMGDYSLGPKADYADYSKLTICCDSGVTNGTRSYREGILKVTNTVTMPTLSGNYPVTINSKRYIPTTNGAGDDNLLVLFWNRPLSEAEVVALNANPWQVFKPMRTVRLAVAAGGTTHNLEGAAAAQAAAQAALSVSVPLAAAGLSVATAEGALSISIPLAGSASAQAEATGALDVISGVALEGAATATANATGGLSVSIPLAGSAVAQALAQAGMSMAKPLAGSAIAEAIANAALDKVVALAGSASGEASGSGTLDALGSVNLSGAAVAEAVASAALSKGAPLTGAAISEALASAGLSKGISLSGAAVSTALAGAGLSISKPLEAGVEVVTSLPVSDLVNSLGSWSSTTSSFWAALAQDDAEYVSASVAGEELRVGLQPITDPQTSTGHRIRVRVSEPTGDGTGMASIQLNQGATTIRSFFALNFPVLPKDYSIVLTAAQADAITDYSDLSLSIYPYGASLAARVHKAEFYVEKGAVASPQAIGTLNKGVTLSGLAQSEAVAVAAFNIAHELAGSAVGESSAAGGLSINVSLSGAAIAEAATNAGLTVLAGNLLAGSAQAQASASGSLTHDVPLAGAALTVSSADGSLTQIVPLAGSAASASSATGGLDVSVRLSGTALAEALAAGGITHIPAATLEGAALAEALAQGSVTLRVNLDGAAVAQAIAAGALSAQGLMFGATPGWVIVGAQRDWAVGGAARSWRITAPTRNWSML